MSPRPRWARWPAGRRRTAMAVAGATVLATLAVPPTAGAEPPASVPAATAAEVSFAATITLISGHVVRYAEKPDGTGTITVISSPPGSNGIIRGYGEPDAFYAIPADAEPLIHAGILDRGLFDVRYLARNGYADDRRSTTPVIVSYQPAAASRTLAAKSSPLAGATRKAELPSVSGEGLAVTKAQSAAFWSSLTGVPAAGPQIRAAATSANQVKKVWLDRKVKVDLADSVALVGTPQAWSAGLDGTGVTVAVLDTGVDAGHPDLAGKVTQTQSFIPDAPSTADGHGHGTHVAATIAGTGAASGGARKGVAPGANLIIGKVLTDAGTGDISWIIDGMEWAAHSGARVVNLSLGSGPSDGTDPGSLAVNALTAETGALFVIAAGNDGPGRGTVSAPSTADAALSVAATTKTDGMADFSGRGPRLTGGIKPEIAAPGVGIVAARAAGTGMGTPVDDRYTSANGTSMATPHVAGAAAILAGQHPDWKADRLKPTLTSTSKDVGFHAYEQGAGRLDVARAVKQTVYTTTSTVDFGAVSPTESPRLDRQITYLNSGSSPVTLTLTPALRNVTGAEVPAGAFTGTAAVTVPAGGTATATFTADLAGLPKGQYSGSVVAIDEATGTRLSVPVGLVRQPPMRKITTRIIGRPGEPLASGVKACTFLQLNDVDGREFYSSFMFREFDGPNVSEGMGLVPDGTYTLSCNDAWSQRGGFVANGAIEVPEITVSGDATLEWDLAKDLVPVNEVGTPHESQATARAIGSSRTTASGVGYFSTTVSGFPEVSRFHVTPVTKKPTIGNYWSFIEQVRAAPEAAVTLHGKGRPIEVRPVYATHEDHIPKFTTDRRLYLATEADLRAGRDVRGKLVIVESRPDEMIYEEVALATTAGAAGVLSRIVGQTPGGHGIAPTHVLDYSTVTIPVLWLDSIQWQQVDPVLNGAARPYLDLRSKLTSPFEYNFKIYEKNRVPKSYDYSFRHRDLVAIQTDYRSRLPLTGGNSNATEVNHSFAPADTFSFNVARYFQAPISRTEYYNVSGPEVRWSRQWELIGFDYPGRPLRGTDSVRGFTRPGTETETVFQATSAVGQLDPGRQSDGMPMTVPCMGCRIGDQLHFFPSQVTASNRSFSAYVPDASASVGLEKDGVAVPMDPESFLPAWNLPPERAKYTLRTVYENPSSIGLGTRVSTDWTFSSAHVGKDTVNGQYLCVPEFLGVTDPCGWQPLIQLSYGLDGLALDDTAAAGRAFTFSVTPWQPAPAKPARIAGITVSVSYDDGAHWTPVPVRRDGDGGYRVRVQHPRLEQTTGAVSIRAEAWDTDGNRVVQQLHRAYGLSAGESRGFTAGN